MGRVTGEHTYDGYTDDLGEMDGLGTTSIPDFLPSPEEFARRMGAPVVYTEDITVTVERETLEFFRREAEKAGTYYLYLIRDVLDEHARAARVVQEAA